MRGNINGGRIQQMKTNLKRKIKRAACIFIPVGFLATIPIWWLKLVACAWIIFVVESVLELLSEYECDIKEDDE